MQHRARKRFGQNFLQDQHIIHSILHAIHPQAADKMVEIGPGLGALTKPLLASVDELIAIEIDTDLIAHLNQLAKDGKKLRLIHADALTFDFSSLGQSLRLIGNLPYNISTPLIIRLLKRVACIQDMHFMLQKEVVDRLAAQPGTKDYGRLSVMAQYYCDVTSLFMVPPQAFNPEPKVNSAIVRLVPHPTSPYPEIAFSDLENLVATAFGMRRKTLANNLKPLLSAQALTRLGINPQYRPEQISVIEYVNIAKFITN